MPADKLKVNNNHHDSIQLSLQELQYPLHQRQQDALSECDRLIKHFQKESTRHRHGWQRLRFFGIVLAVLTTGLAALAASQSLGEYEWVVPAVSGLATLFMALLSQTSAQKVWLQSRSIQQHLHIEKFLYLQGAGDYANMTDEEAQIRYFSRRVMEIWSASQKDWEQSLIYGDRHVASATKS